jgi:hypothetical protein
MPSSWPNSKRTRTQPLSWNRSSTIVEAPGYSEESENLRDTSLNRADGGQYS